jgi:hypothetical protein
MKTRDELAKELRRQTRMTETRDNKIAKINAELKTKLKAAQKELKASRKEVSSKQKELKASQIEIGKYREINDVIKKKLAQFEIQQQSIAQPQYCDFVVSFAVDLCNNYGCSLRQVPPIIDYVSRKFKLNLPKIPCYTSVKNWSEKVGYSIYAFNSDSFSC